MSLDEVAKSTPDDPQAAFQKLRAVMGFPSDLVSADDWSRAFSLFKEIGSALGDESDLGAALERGASDSSDPQVLFDIGYELIEQRLYGIAASVLSRADEASPGNPVIVDELVCAFEHTMLNAEACRVLRAYPELTATPTVSRYLLAFHSMMTGDVETARELYPALLESGDDTLIHMGGGIAAMVGRADALAGVCALDDRDLRGWHFVLNGALLLHISPHGLDEPMRGRYAWIQDSNEAIQEGIRKVEATLGALGQAPERVFALADRGSQILAHATASIMGIPVVDWPPGDEGSDQPGLIAVYDLEDLDGDTLVSIADHRPGQVLWAHGATWTQDPPFCPDLVTMLFQTNNPPWGERMGYDADAKRDTTTPPSTASVEELAHQIVSATAGDARLADAVVVTDLAALLKNAVGATDLVGALRGEGRRRRQWLGSPVPSARFT